MSSRAPALPTAQRISAPSGARSSAGGTTRSPRATRLRGSTSQKRRGRSPCASSARASRLPVGPAPHMSNERSRSGPVARWWARSSVICSGLYAPPLRVSRPGESRHQSRTWGTFASRHPPAASRSSRSQSSAHPASRQPPAASSASRRKVVLGCTSGASTNRAASHCSGVTTESSHASSRARPGVSGRGKHRTRLPTAPSETSPASISACRRSRSGSTRSSASMRAIKSPRQRASPSCSAATRPRPSPGKTRTRASDCAKCASASPVPSVDASSMQITSNGGAPRCRRIPSSAAPAVAAAFRAGKSTLITAGGYRCTAIDAAPRTGLRADAVRANLSVQCPPCTSCRLGTIRDLAGGRRGAQGRALAGVRGTGRGAAAGPRRRGRVREEAVTRPAKVSGLRAETPLRAAAEQLLHARLADVRAAEARAARRLDAKTVHDLRVACRRLRAAVKMFGKKRLRALDGRIERLQDALGEVRDLQLQLRWLARHRADVREVGRRLRDAEARLRLVLALWTRRSEPLLLRALTGVHAGGRLGGSRTRKRLRKRIDRLEEALAGAERLEPREAHLLRIAAKKLRYDAELLRNAFDLAGAIAVLSEVQSALGELHDADVGLERVRAKPRLARAARAERSRITALARRSVRRAKLLCSRLRKERL